MCGRTPGRPGKRRGAKIGANLFEGEKKEVGAGGALPRPAAGHGEWMTELGDRSSCYHVTPSSSGLRQANASWLWLSTMACHSLLFFLKEGGGETVIFLKLKTVQGQQQGSLQTEYFFFLCVFGLYPPSCLRLLGFNQFRGQCFLPMPRLRKPVILDCLAFYNRGKKLYYSLFFQSQNWHKMTILFINVLLFLCLVNNNILLWILRSSSEHNVVYL